MIKSFNCPILGVRLQSTVRLLLCRLIRGQNTAVYAPVTFEEIVIVMIMLANYFSQTWQSPIIDVIQATVYFLILL